MALYKPPRPKREQKIVIFDSPDGTGKTNIAQGLSMELKVPYFRMQSQHENWRKGKFKEALQFDQTYLVELLRQTKYDVIIDRAYPSEWVYSQVFNRDTDMETLEQVDDAFARLGAYIVIPVRRDYSNSREDDLIPREMLQRLHDKYLEFAEWTRCGTTVIYVDDFKDDLKREIEMIKPELKFDEELSWTFKVVISREEKKVDFGSSRDRGKR